MSLAVSGGRHLQALLGALGRLARSPLATLLTGLAIREHVPQIEVAVADNATALVLRTLAEPPAADLALLSQFAAAQVVPEAPIVIARTILRIGEHAVVLTDDLALE